jgi:hypothetical protein
MNWLKKFPWLSLMLLLLTYAVFGWYYGSWTAWLVRTEAESGWFLQENIATILIEFIGAFLVLVMVLGFAAPIALMTFSVGNWLKNDTRAFIALLIASAIGVIVIYWLQYLAQFTLLLGAASLFRLELQTLGCKSRLSTWLLVIVCLLGFALGVFAHTFWNSSN